MALVDGIAGGLAGIATTAVFYPLSLMNVRVQAEFSTTTSSSSSSSSSSSGTSASTSGNSALSLAVRTLQTDGVPGFYVGVTPFLIKDALTTALQFFFKAFVHDLYVKFIQKGRAATSLFSDVLIGVIGCALTNLLILPIDTVIVKTQTSQTGFFEVVQEVLKDYGFYKGLIPTQILTLNPAITFAIFDKLKPHFQKQYGDNAIVSFLAAMVSKVIALVVTYPIIRSKILLQAAQNQNRKQPPTKPDCNTSSSSASPPSSPPLPSSSSASSTVQVMQLQQGKDDGLQGLLYVMSQIVKMEGAAGLYKGLSSQMTLSVLAAAMMFATKDKAVALVNRMMTAGVAKK